jgi:hypothetical protein
MKDALGILLAVIIGAAAIFGISYGGYELYAYFAPRYTAVDNKVFHESQQYNDGMIRDLENLKLEYVNADKDHKDVIRAVVLHRFSVYPEDKMPPDLRNFYEQLQSGK